ncbi:MAG: formyltransferase family protein [Planctomycetaceae bacterium]
MQSKTPSFKSAIIGQTAQPVQFANLLLQSGHDLAAACSPDGALRNWATSKSVPHFSDLRAFTEACRESRIDFLFSIVNFRILPRDLLSIPTRMAINYHDGPLPKYAGIHVTTWAIMNQETVHGITWHVIEEQIDTGDILKQVLFPIDSRETAASLNMKCFLAAGRSFRILLQELQAGTYFRIPQKSEERTYFGLRTPLPAVDDSWSAARIDAYSRALDFGTGANPFAKRIPAGVAQALARA